MRARVNPIGCVALAVAALAFAGCGDAWQHDGAASTQQAIVNGEPSDESENAVLNLYAGPRNARSQCTATLIAPNLILTALHCVAEYEDTATFTCRSDGTLTATSVGGRLGSTVDPQTIEVTVGPLFKEEPDARGVQVFSTGSVQICRHDIAVVLLDRELDAPIAPVRVDRPMKADETMRIVGFGVSEVAEVSRFRRTGVRVLGIGEDGRNPKQGSAAPYTFVLGEGACYGDSGGPAFSEETGALTGVYSISAGLACTATGIRNVYTMVAPFAPLLKEAFEAAGYEPLVEPAESVGEGGSGGDSSTGGGDTGGAQPVSGSGGRAGDTGIAGMDPVEPGSGSREDVSCACRTPGFGAPSRATAAWLLASGLALALWRRRSRV